MVRIRDRKAIKDRGFFTAIAVSSENVLYSFIEEGTSKQESMSIILWDLLNDASREEEDPEMNGEVAFEVFATEMAKSGRKIISWSDLEEKDKASWGRIASRMVRHNGR